MLIFIYYGGEGTNNEHDQREAIVVWRKQFRASFGFVLLWCQNHVILNMFHSRLSNPLRLPSGRILHRRVNKQMFSQPELCVYVCVVSDNFVPDGYNTGGLMNTLAIDRRLNKQTRKTKEDYRTIKYQYLNMICPTGAGPLLIRRFG